MPARRLLMPSAVLAACGYCLEALETPQYGSTANASSSIFHHLALQSSIVLGNYLYIDGGEITTWDGHNSDSQVTAKQNYTWSIDLTTSWTNASVTINNIPKGDAPVVNTGGLWLTDDGNTFFAYDGGLGLYVDLAEQSPASNELWQFIPSGASGGWSKVAIPPSSNFTTLIRTTDGAYASGNGLAFALGGHVDQWTVAGVEAAYNVSGMVMYNSSSLAWYNVSSTGYSYEVGISRGAGLFVPSFGPVGLMFVFGGVAGGTYATFDYAYMFEPASQQWKWQQTTGTIPGPVARPCAVGVDSGNGTYEIFLYGGAGTSFEGSLEAAAVHVLSLPSFHWHKRNLNARNYRSGHSCNVVGNRQMAVIGGFVNDQQSEDIPDIWSNGIGIYDLSELSWKRFYDASAEPYVTPQSVRKYNDENPYPRAFSDATVEYWFKRRGNSISNSTSTDAKNQENPGDSSTGAIVGGVVGGVLGLALVAVLAFIMHRRRKGRVSSESDNLKPHQSQHAEADGVPVSELGSRQLPHEAAGVPKSELMAKEHTAAELPGSHVSYGR